MQQQQFGSWTSAFTNPPLASRSLKTRVDWPNPSERPGGSRCGLCGSNFFPEMEVPCAEARSMTVTEPDAETVSVACSREMEPWLRTMSATSAWRPTLYTRFDADSSTVSTRAPSLKTSSCGMEFLYLFTVTECEDELGYG